MTDFSGTQYIKIDIANQFGLDRLKWQERIWWVDDNRADLLNQQAQAKYPTAYNKALRALQQAEAEVPINHIMGLDATASGLQIMGAMSCCRSSAAATNLIDTGKREDVYTSVGEQMSKLLNIPIDRKEIKKPIMTYFYGSTAVPKKVFGEGAQLAAFHEALGTMLPGPTKLMSLLQEQWNPNAIRHMWAMPDGHVAYVPVSAKEDKGLEIDEADHLRFTYRAEVVKPLLKSRSLAANIIHSIDGWICREMVKGAKEQGFYLATIHDCFYAHPNHMNKVRQLYRECMAEVAKMNLVTSILSQIANRTVDYLPLSKREDLAKDILQSEYALS